MTSRRRSRPSRSAAGGTEGSASNCGLDSTEAEDVVEDALADLWSYSGSGASSGRGYHFQDSIGAWLAATIFAGQIGIERLVPEGLEDLSGEGADPWHVQVKSRQERIGDFTALEAAGHVIKAWIRHRERERLQPGARLAVVFERAIETEKLAGWGVAVADALPPDHRFLAELRGQATDSGLDTAETAAMCSSVYVVVLGWERATEETIDVITSRVTLLRGEALPVALALRGAVADCADDNAERGWDNRSGLSRTDIETLVRQTVELIDREGLSEAVASGICDPVDFRSAATPAGFYQGVDVQPSHVVAGLVQPRPKLTDEIVEALNNSQVALIVGPSGVGKSATAWSTAYVMRHVLWYRLWRLQAGDVEPLLRLARASGASLRTPVGFVVDAVGRADIQEWDALQRRASAIPGLLMLGTARMEDLLPLRTLPECGLVHVSLDEELAERIYRGLAASGATTAAHWRHAYDQAAGLTLEYTHLLTRGRRLGAVIGEQVRARLDGGRNEELDLLAITSVAHRWGASVPVPRLRDHLGISNAALSAALSRLANELLLQVQHDQVTGLHQLRSAVLVDAIHAAGSPSLAESAHAVVDLVEEPHLRPFVAGLLADRPEVDPVLIACLADKVGEQPDASLLAGILQALRVVDFHRIASAWPAVLHRHGVPAADRVVTIQMAMWIREPLSQVRPEIAAAASEIAETDQDTSPLRDELLRRLRVAPVVGTLLGCSTPQQAIRLLGALANCPSDVVEHLHSHSLIDSPLARTLLDADLHDLAAVLSAARQASSVIADKLFDALGGDSAMLDRFRAAYPWATDVHVAAPGGACTPVVRLAHINDDQQPDADEQARHLGRLLLRCFPRCAAVDITTHLAVGIDYRIGGYPPGVSTLQRCYEHGPVQVAWNRARLRIATAPVGATDTTQWLHTAAQLLDDLSTFTDDLLRLWVRGSGSSQKLESVQGQMVDLGRRIDELPAPIEITQLGTEDVDEQGTVPSGHPFHTLARGLVANLPVRLPQRSEWRSLVGFVGDILPGLIGQLRVLHWQLVGRTSPPHSLDELTATLRALHDIMTALATDELTLDQIQVTSRDSEPRRALRRAAASARAAAAARQRQLTNALEQQIYGTGLRVEVLTQAAGGVGVPGQKEYALTVHLDSLTGWLPALAALQPILTAHPFANPVLVVPFRRGRPVRGLACTFVSSFLPDTGLYGRWAANFPDAHATPLASAFVRANDAIRALSAIGEVQRQRGFLDVHTDLAGQVNERLRHALDEIAELPDPDAVHHSLVQHLHDLLQRLGAELADPGSVEDGTIAAAIARGYLGEATPDWVVRQIATMLAYEWDIDRQAATQLLEEWPNDS